MDERYGEVYRYLYQHHWWWRARERLILAVLGELLPQSARASILDVGCGDGLLFDRLAEFGDVEGIETDGGLVTRSGRWAHAIRLTPFDETFQPGKLYTTILMLDVLEHVDGPSAFLRRAYDLLEPSGQLLITVPAFRAIWTRLDALNHHRTRFTRSTLVPLVAAAGFRVDRARYYFQWLFAVKAAVRVAEALRPGSPAVPKVPARWINQMVYRLSMAEQAVARAVPIPFGSSLMVIASKPPSGSRTGHADEGVLRVAPRAQ